MNLKESLFTLVLGAALVPAAMAGPGERDPVARMEKYLALSEQQVEQMRQLHEQHREQVRALLTEEQRQKLDEFRTERAERDSHRRERRW